MFFSCDFKVLLMEKVDEISKNLLVFLKCINDDRKKEKNYKFVYENKTTSIQESFLQKFSKSLKYLIHNIFHLLLKSLINNNTLQFLRNKNDLPRISSLTRLNFHRRFLYECSFNCTFSLIRIHAYGSFQFKSIY